MKTGIFLGSFDPIHLGHINLITNAMRACELDNVSLVPAWQNVTKKQSTDYDIRLNMCQCAVRNIKDVYVDLIELNLHIIQNTDKVYSIDVLKYFKLRKPDIDYQLILSKETYKELPKWKNFEQILILMPILLEGRDFAVSKYDFHSTDIRNRIKQGEDIKNMVPEGIPEFLEHYNPYK